MGTNKGGYQIINFKNNDLLLSPNVPGLYELIEGSYYKAIMLEGLNFGGVEKHSVYSIPTLSGSSYVFQNVYGYDISIDSDDNVSVASTAIVYKSTIEGGTLDNAKPIYCHPITIIKPNTYRLTALIFNNSVTALTLSTFKDFIDNLYTSVGSNARVMLSGAYNTGNGVIIASFIGKSDAGYSVYGLDTSGNDKYVTNADFDQIFANDTVFVDGVNKIN